MTNAALLKDHYRNRVAQRSQMTFPDILSDPLIRTMMRADRVNPVKLEAELREVADSLHIVPDDARAECLAC